MSRRWEDCAKEVLPQDSGLSNLHILLNLGLTANDIFAVSADGGTS